MEQLTGRELEVVCLLPLPNKGIARRLGISPQTVKNHITNIAKKLDCRGVGGQSVRLKILLIALKWGFVTMSEVYDPERRYAAFVREGLEELGLGG